jgi:hypothetical protein
MASNGATIAKIGPMPEVTTQVTKAKTKRAKPPRTPAKQASPPARKDAKPAAAPAPAKPQVKPGRAAMAGVALVALVVSLTHLSNGVITLAETSVWEGWAMAIVFDLFLVADEYLMLTCEFTDKTGKLAAEALLALVVVWSMYLNAVAFSHNHFDFEHGVQIGWGITLPLAIMLAVYAASRSK